MKEGAELSHGDKEIRRKENDEQTSRKSDMTAFVLRRRHDNAKRRTAVGDEIHDRDGVELHGQHLHGNLSEFLRLPVHLLIFEAVRLIDLQRGQPLQIFKESVAQRRVLSPVF